MYSNRTQKHSEATRVEKNVLLIGRGAKIILAPGAERTKAGKVSKAELTRVRPVVF